MRMSQRASEKFARVLFFFGVTNGVGLFSLFFMMKILSNLSVFAVLFSHLLRVQRAP